MRSVTLLAAASVAAAVVPGAARANCAAPATYFLRVEGNTVTVQPTDAPRGCPDPGGMLRQDVATGDTARLADFCGAADPQGYFGAPYVDECVAPGAYRYGFADAFACQPGACGTYRYAVVEVSAALPAGCERSAGNAAPTPVADAPWTASNELICGYGNDDDGGPLGCATAPGAAGAVAALDGLVLGAGLLLLRRRARRR